MMNRNRIEREIRRRRRRQLADLNRNDAGVFEVMMKVTLGALAVIIGLAIWFWAAAERVESQAWASTGRWESAGTYTITYYCPCRRCSGKYGYQTASGARCTEGRTIAVDRRVIPLGTRIMIDGHEYIAEDTGVRGKWIDVFMESHSECLRNGMKKKEVFIWR